MKILVIGSGGREHALVLKLAQSQKSSLIYTSNYAASTSTTSANSSSKKAVYTDTDLSTNSKVISFCREKNIDLVVIGPEAPLERGLADDLKKEKIKVFGANKNAARLEFSKDYSKSFMKKYQIPTADYRTFNDFDQAQKYLENAPPPIVIKVDGLAAGKGVRVCLTKDEANKTLIDFMKDKIMGESGTKVVIEEYLEGREASIMAFMDSHSYKFLPVSRDHKRLLNNDKGPNTGGMGVFSPVEDITKDDLEFIRENVFDKVIKGLKEEKIDFCGILYAGVMKGKEGIKVLEFNCRFGDPETQVVLPLLGTDLLEIILACIDRNLESIDLHLSSKASVCTILASKDYPYASSKTEEILGLQNVQNALVFHSGTIFKDNKYYTNGGRVLAVVGISESKEIAKEITYKEIKKISFQGMQYRTDIGEEK